MMDDCPQIIGGSGFIGTSLSRQYLNNNQNFLVIDKNLPSNSEYNFIKVDITDKRHFIKKRNQGPIINLAAEHRDDVTPKSLYYSTNVEGAKNVCDYAVKHSINKLIFSSSATVYGEPKKFPTPETYTSPQTSVYGASKLCGEAYIQAYAEYGHFNATIFRFVSWTGIGYSHGVIYDFVKKLLNDQNNLEILGNGSQTKSYLDVMDGINGVISLSSLNKNKSEIFNLGHKETMNVIDLAKIICDEMSLSKVSFNFTGGERGWIGDSPLVHLDTSKANNLGWEPKISIEDSIRSTVRYLLEDKSRIFR